MMINNALLIGALTLFACAGRTSLQALPNHEHTGSQCLLNKKEAIATGEQRLTAEFGKAVKKYRPFSATLQDDSIWVVRTVTKSNKGGGPYIEISAKSCKTLLIEFSK